MAAFNVATCQFPVRSDIKRNSTSIQRLLLSAREQGAQVVHLPEGALPGYAGALRQHRTGMMLNCVDTEEEFVEKCSFRDLAVQGILHSGTAVDDPRSRQRITLMRKPRRKYAARAGPRKKARCEEQDEDNQDR